MKQQGVLAWDLINAPQTQTHTQRLTHSLKAAQPVDREREKVVDEREPNGGNLLNAGGKRSKNKVDFRFFTYVCIYKSMYVILNEGKNTCILKKK